MKTTKKPNIKKYAKVIEKLQTKTALAPALNEIILEIQERTQKGKNVKGGSFDKYSDDYGDWKAKEHKSRKVNLTVTNNMLHSITYKKIKDGMRLYFGTKTENEKAYHNQKTLGRKFFGLSKSQNAKFLKYVKNYYRKASI